MSMNEEEERAYTLGRRQAMVGMIGHCVRDLDIDDPEAAHVRWIQERELVVHRLRELCAEYGDSVATCVRRGQCPRR